MLLRLLVFIAAILYTIWLSQPLLMTAISLLLLAFVPVRKLVSEHSASLQEFQVLIALFLLSILMTQLSIQRFLDLRVSQDSPESVTASAYIKTIPMETEFGFKAEIKFGDRNLIAYWQAPLVLHAGEQWQTTCRLKPMKPTYSPGAPNPVTQAFIAGIHGTCYIQEARLIDGNPGRVQQVRNYIIQWLDAGLDSSRISGLSVALLTGDRSRLSPDLSELLRQTGTSHLFVVSGLHLGLVFALAYAISGVVTGWLAVFTPVTKQDVQWLTGLLAALCYAWLCQFPIPTQRALVMLCVPAIMVWLRIPVRLAQSYAMAMFAVLVVDPVAILSASFWLSFVAVAVLIFVLKNRYPSSQNRTIKVSLMFIQAQLLISLGLLPLILMMGQPPNPASILVNLIAIPVVSTLLLPGLVLALGTSLLWGQGAQLLLNVLAHAFQWLLQLLAWATQYQMSWLPSEADFFILVALVIIWLLPGGIPGKAVPAVLLTVLLLVRKEDSMPGQLGVSVIDVGQGQSVLVTAGFYNILVDTGPGNPDYGAFQRVVKPYLAHKGILDLDLLVVSHNDLDHASAMNTVPELVPSPLWLFGESESNANLCVRGQTINLDELKIEFLAPFDHYRPDGNDSSCVIRIQYRKDCVLIPGDISKLVEYAVIDNSAQKQLNCGLLIASHHGSTSSTSLDWLQFVNPGVVAFSSGWQNRFNHPSVAVIDNVERVGATWFSTADSGTLEFELNDGSISVHPSKSSIRYWQY